MEKLYERSYDAAEEDSHCAIPKCLFFSGGSLQTPGLASLEVYIV